MEQLSSVTTSPRLRKLQSASIGTLNFRLLLNLSRMLIMRVSLKKNIVAWCWVGLWMVTIFSASTDLGSPERTSRIIGPFLRWLNPEVQQITVDRVQLVARKTAHAAGYAILAALLWNALGRSPSGWNRVTARRAIFITSAYAATDEIHQAFVPGRSALVGDVCLDTAGGILGIYLIWWIGRRSKKW